MISLSSTFKGNSPNERTYPPSPTAAYLHIPFCRRRCYYCDFPIVVVGDRPPLARQGQPSYGVIDQYLPVLQQEIRATPSLGTPLKTVFFGGGTPSLLTAEQLKALMDTLDHQFGLEPDAECSIEIDPDTIKPQQLAGYIDAGINRISLGVQAFQPKLLAACGRTHSPDDIDVAVGLIRQMGVTNLSLDLISGLPNQTMDQWIESLERAIALEPTHISVYDLIVEPMTAFARWYEPGQSPLPSDELTAEMYRTTSNLLAQAGFEHYEISNYAKPGYPCQHNRVYWENRPYYGFGLGAASFIHGHRFTRPRKRQAYEEWVQGLTETRVIQQVQTMGDRLLDTLMLGLRLAEGIDLTVIAADFGDAILNRLLSVVAPFQEQGWVAVDAPKEGKEAQAQHLRLTDPEGFLFSNVVLSTLFEAFMDEDSVLRA
ncbi:MAG: coproporphyrinogen III oxidase [Synechococcales cyanobacterium T60_A2020_003]|nr:coproporphyrinogen III oxidase [Synechococcales cyanobacterium T60_A2020_003]